MYMLEKTLLVSKMFMTALDMVTSVLQTTSGLNLKLMGKDATFLKKSIRNPKADKTREKRAKMEKNLHKIEIVFTHF